MLRAWLDSWPDAAHVAETMPDLAYDGIREPGPVSNIPSPQTAASRYDAFLSYHWRDRAQVEDLARALRAQGLHVFLDRWYLRPGRPWPQELEAVLRECRAVVVCVGPGEMGPWQQREAHLALQRHIQEAGFPVIPVLLRGAEPALGFLSQHTWVDLRAAPDDPVLLGILAAAVRGEPPGPDARDRVARTLATVCPYRGLLYFREEDAPFFCGRDAAIARLVEAVGRGPLVAVVGASGSGKSSVVRAGLVPALRRDGTRVWDIVTIGPGARPLHALAAGLLPLLEPEMREVERLIEVNRLAGALEAGEVHLTEVVARAVTKQPGTDRLLLVADQWEELYTLTPNEGIRRRAIDELLAATTAGPLTVVLTLRGDFVGHALAYRPLADRLQGAQVNLGPMVREELRRAVEEPAAKVGLRFEAGLVDRILDDAGDEPGNLPLLEFVLRQLWERRQQGELQHAAYEDLGRLQGAVAKKADEVFGRLSALEQQAVQRVFLRLATLTDGGDYARRRALQSDLGAGVLEVVKKLADERLLVMAPGATHAEEETTVEVAHETLLRRWGRLKAWLDGHREFLLWRGRFFALVVTWRTVGKHSDALAAGVFLNEAERWQREQGDQLAPEEHEYIAASLDRRRREVEAEQTRARALADAEAEWAREAEARRALEAELANRAADTSLRSEAEAAAGEWERSGRDSSHLWPRERLVLVHEALARLGVDQAALPEPARSFLRPETEWLPGELERPETSHARRAAIGDRLDVIGHPRPGVGLRPDGLPDIVWCEIPAGAVTLEGVQGHFTVAAFLIAKYPVTYRQYRAFLDDPAGYRDQRWWDGLERRAEPGKQHRPTGNCPAENVSWDDAMAYCRWLSAGLSYEVRLPTEPEWQQAATGGDPGNEYPWGAWADGKANTDESRLSRTTAVGMYPGGASPQRVLDFVGNVWEWCLTDYARPEELAFVERPSRPRGARSEVEGRAEVRRVVRGGSWNNTRDYARCAFRSSRSHPDDRYNYIGFRVVRGSPIP